ncbi:MAG: cytochrome C [Rhodospirillaceae bacterium]|nr:MAG: cytochrome C [Rhodospirillaceae bacterium]
MNMNIVGLAVGALVIGGVGVTFLKSEEPTNRSVDGHSTPKGQAFAPKDIKLPAFNLTEKRGEAAYTENCAACHGERTVGTDQGPPFLHRVYVPGHHGDAAFYSAAKIGVRQHHWQFGNMPPLPDISDGTMKSIIAYIRGIQSVNGFE